MARICRFCKAINESRVETCRSCGGTLAVIRRGFVVALRYVIDSLLGKGGMGAVYRAHELETGEAVALKLLRPDLARTPEMGRRFRSEIQIASRVRHRNVCRIHCCGEDRGFRYIVMDLIEGSDLKQILEMRGALPAAEAFDLGSQLASGLSAVHDVGIIHRDIKTRNVICDGDGVAKIMDFDTSKQFLAEGTLTDATASSRIFVTPEYMSPEQARGLKLDYRTDIYSLGVVIYEIFTARVPFQGDTTMDTVIKHLEQPPPFDGPVAAQIPGPLVPVLKKALEKDRARRYRTVHEMAEALKLAREASLPSQKKDTVASAGREQASRTLPPTPLATLLRALQGPADSARGAAIFARLGPAAQSALPVLQELLARRDATVRLQAAHALRNMPPATRRSLRALLGALNRREATVRWDAAALEDVDIAERAIRALADALHVEPQVVKASDPSGQVIGRLKGGVTPTE